MENENSELWKNYKDAQQERRAERLPIRQQEIEDLTKLGYKVKKKTDYHYRINDAIDVWPIHNKYHILKGNKRGSYKNVTEFIQNKLPLNK